MKMVGIYVHLPFCRAKCHYCDFVSYVGRREGEKNAYLLALGKEGELYRRRFAGVTGKSLYIGGGTPTCLTGGQLFRLFRILHHLFQLPQGIEVTVEANPGTLNADKLTCLREAGCNRLSLGVQSFSSRDLQVLGRIHTPREAVAAYEQARQAGFTNINLDLMYGLPGQDLPGWRTILRKAAELRPEHLSLYQLNIEKETPFGQLLHRGLFAEFDQDKAFLMYEEAINFLESKGYRHYEISNFALPEKEAFHNQLYWLNEEYLGLGAGAAGFLQGVRYKNTAELSGYQEQLSQGKLPIIEEELIDEELSMAETMFLGLRRREGVNKEQFRQKYGLSIENKYGVVLAKLIKQGLLEETSTQIALSRKGLYIANLVMQEFLP
jgi:oxygen-independent coproporphyrinogen-3 oxidase